MAYTKYSLTPANNTATPPDGAPEGMLPSAVNDTMRDMMAQIRDCGDGIRDGTYTMTAPKITGGTITGATINNSAIGGTTANTGAFTTLSATGNVSFDGGSFVFNEAGADKDARFEGDTDANLLFLDASTDRIGIGTSSPAGKLHISRTNDTGGVAAYISNTSDIGNTTPFIDLIFTQRSNNADGGKIRAGRDGIYSATTSTMDSYMAFFTAVDNVDTERMRIDSSGNVLVNTTSTGADGLNIAVSKNISFAEGSGVSYANIFRQSSSAALVLAMGYKYTATASGFASSVGTSIAKSAISLGTVAGGITFYADAAVTTANGTDVTPTERMRITSGGDLCVGRTSSLGSVKFVVESDTTTYNPMTVSNTRSTAGTDYQIIMYRNGSIVGSIQTSLSATSYVTSSDYRLKEHITPMTGALAKVAQLKPCTYMWKETGDAGQGFIAHELQEVIPDAVTGEKDAVNEDGSIKPQGVDTSFLVATLTAAIQELNAKVEAQAAEIALLKSK